MKQAKNILKLATDLNFYGKRKRDTKLETAENIVSELQLLDVEPADLVVWLDSAKPAKAAKAKAQSNKPAASTIISGHAEKPALPVLFADADAVIITAAQNNTAPHAQAWQALKDFAGDNNARLIVAPVYYNKQAFSSTVQDENERFDPEFLPYLVTADSDIFGQGIATIYANAAVPATQKQPVNAAATLNSGELLSIVPALRQQLKTLVSPAGQAIREAWSSGTVTGINYTRSRAGSEAASDHCLGGILLTYCHDTETLYARNLVYKNGVILDSCTVEPLEAVAVLGDLHCEVKDPENWERTLNWLEQVQPLEIVVHDILHFSTRSHHQINKGDHLYRTQDASVKNDLLTVINDINTLAAIAPVYIVESNHNSSLDIWINDLSYNPKKDPKQAKFYYLLNWLVCDAIDNKESCQLALKVAFDNLSQFDEFPALADNITFGQMHKTAQRYGYEISTHGHKGQNGSQGSTALYSKWGYNMVTGHTHSPAIINKVLTVGVTAKLDQNYNRGGGSSWNQSHGLILPNGVAQIVPMRGLFR